MGWEFIKFVQSGLGVHKKYISVIKMACEIIQTFWKKWKSCKFCFWKVIGTMQLWLGNSWEGGYEKVGDLLISKV